MTFAAESPVLGPDVRRAKLLRAVVARLLGRKAW